MNIKIIFETQTGTTQYVAELIQDQLVAAGHKVTLHSIKYDGPNPSLEGYDVVLFGGPTYDDGKLEKNLREFIQAYQPDLSKYKVAVFGLGNRNYPQFCISADLLENWIKERGGTLLVETLRVDGFPDHVEKIKQYSQQLISALQ